MNINEQAAAEGRALSELTTTEKGGDASCDKNTSTQLIQPSQDPRNSVASNAAPTVQPAGAAQDQPSVSCRTTDDKPKDWTVARQDDAIALHCGRNKPILFDRLPGRVVLFRLVADAHNAELAAERKHSAFCSKIANERLEEIAKLKRQVANEGYVELVGQKLAAERENFVIATKLAAEKLSDKHARELTAERQRREQAERMLDLAGGQNWGIDNLKNLDELHGTVIKLRNKVVELDQQLLSALAAIEKHNSFGCHCGRIYADLSVLREHDAELRAQWEKEHEQSK